MRGIKPAARTRGLRRRHHQDEFRLYESRDTREDIHVKATYVWTYSAYVDANHSGDSNEEDGSNEEDDADDQGESNESNDSKRDRLR